MLALPFSAKPKCDVPCLITFLLCISCQRMPPQVIPFMGNVYGNHISGVLVLVGVALAVYGLAYKVAGRVGLFRYAMGVDICGTVI